MTTFKTLSIYTAYQGFAISIMSYGVLYISIHLFPSLFVDYFDPIFSSDGSRDLLFYLHPFILSAALAYIWPYIQPSLKGSYVRQGISFGFKYGFVSLLPVLWMTFSAMEITLIMVISWWIYGIFQASIGGIVCAYLHERDAIRP